MGILVWLISGLLACLLCRLIPAARPPGRLVEYVVSCSVATVAGLVATALDFAGWNDPDWRAALFCFLAALAAIAISRIARVRFFV